MSTSTLSSAVERVADSDLEVSLRESLTRVFVRPWLFVTCLLIPPIIAVGFTSLVPTTYRATVKILIRYGASEGAFLRDLIPDNRSALSGVSSAEILRSLPSAFAAVKAQGIQDGDIAKGPKDILSGLVGRYLPSRHDRAETHPGMSDADVAALGTAEAFQASLADSAGASTTKYVEVLEKGVGTLPAAQRGDDLITLTVPSFNREKVAAMANGLAEAFIAEYARLSADEAHRSVVFLDKLIADAQIEAPARLAGMRQVGATGSERGAFDDIYRQSPLLESAAKELAIREADLARVASVYAPGSAVVADARAAVESVRRSMNATERQEVQKLAVEQLKLRRYQAANTEQLFRNGLAPISIVEAAVTPKRTSAASRYVVSGAVGLALGLMLGLSVVVVLSVADQRLHTSWDVERAMKLPLMGALPDLPRSTRGTGVFSQPRDARLEHPFLQLSGRLDLSRGDHRGMALGVTSATGGEGKTFVVTGLAAVLARGGRSKVLVVDADLAGRGLSAGADPSVDPNVDPSDASDRPGLIDALIDAKPFSDFALPTACPGVDLLPAGRAARRAELGFYRADFERALAQARDSYDVVLVDTAAVLEGNEPMMCGTAVDGLLWVASAGTSRRPLLRAALAKLRDVGLRPIGVVLNRRRERLPAFVWRHV